MPRHLSTGWSPTVKKALKKLPRARDAVFPWIYDFYQLTGKNSTHYPNIISADKIKPEGAVLTFHCWRHTFRTRLAAAEVPQDVAMKLGDWTNESTAEIYNHDFTQLTTAINALD